ncbi:hypothetical protein [Pseudosporangium ferrugineum]|nr:hypothetical protein [Pseudosporangium ferrugineum]
MSEPQEAVVEFGPEPPPSRRTGVPAFLRGLATDRRLVPLAAALGALALFGSLVSEWQLTEIDATVFRDVQTGTRAFGATVADLGGWGAAYLVGLFLLTASVVLTLFGPPGGRVYARLTALSTGGVQLAIVLALWSSLDETTRVAGQLDVSGLDSDEITLTLGRGPWCAAFGVVLVLLAVYLAGRLYPPVTAPGREPAAGEEAEAGPPPVWSWRRPSAEDETPPDAPFDLTVTPAQPWTASDDSRDKPS